MRQIIINAIIGLFSLALYGQQTVTVGLDSNVILVGDQVLMNVIMNHGDSEGFIVPDYQKALSSLEEIEVLSIRQADTMDTESGIKVKQPLLVTSFDSGSYVIPKIPFRTLRGDTVFSNEVFLVVDPVPMDDNELADIKPIIEEEARVTDWIHRVLIPMGLLILAGLIFFLIKRRKKSETVIQEIPKARPKEEAHTIALRKLDALEIMQLLQKGKIKEYYAELSLILREFLENRFEVNALESVTGDIVRDLEPVEMVDGYKEHLGKFLGIADLAKFAKVLPGEEAHLFYPSLIRRFITDHVYVAPPPIEEENPEDEI